MKSKFKQMIKQVLFLSVLFLSFGKSVFAQCTIEEAEQLMTTEYSVEEIEKIKTDHPKKYEKLIYYYTNSWILIPGEVPHPDAAASNILISRFEPRRMENDRVEIKLSNEGDKLILKSKKEVNEQYNLIESKY